MARSERLHCCKALDLQRSEDGVRHTTGCSHAAEQAKPFGQILVGFLKAPANRISLSCRQHPTHKGGYTCCCRCRYTITLSSTRRGQAGILLTPGLSTATSVEGPSQTKAKTHPIGEASKPSSTNMSRCFDAELLRKRSRRMACCTSTSASEEEMTRDMTATERNMKAERMLGSAPERSKQRDPRDIDASDATGAAVVEHSRVVGSSKTERNMRCANPVSQRETAVQAARRHRPTREASSDSNHLRHAPDKRKRSSLRFGCNLGTAGGHTSGCHGRLPYLRYWH